MSRVLALVVSLSLALPALAQPSDAPLVAPCKPGDVVLSPEVAIDRARRLAEAEAKVKVYEASPPLPAWAVILLVGGGVLVGGAVVAGIWAAQPAPRGSPP